MVSAGVRGNNVTKSGPPRALIGPGTKLGNEPLRAKWAENVFDQAF